MNKDVYLEVNASQKPAIELLQAMGYTYISPEDCEKQRGSKYHVLLKDILLLAELIQLLEAMCVNDFIQLTIQIVGYLAIIVKYQHFTIFRCIRFPCRKSFGIRIARMCKLSP